MQKFKGLLAAALVATSLATFVAPTVANAKAGGYVKATTYKMKNGTIVHRKGYYRHATKPGAKMTAPTSKMAAPMAPTSKMATPAPATAGSKMGATKPAKKKFSLGGLFKKKTQ